MEERAASLEEACDIVFSEEKPVCASVSVENIGTRCLQNSDYMHNLNNTASSTGSTDNCIEEECIGDKERIGSEDGDSQKEGDAASADDTLGDDEVAIDVVIQHDNDVADVDEVDDEEDNLIVEDGDALVDDVIIDDDDILMSHDNDDDNLDSYEHDNNGALDYVYDTDGDDDDDGALGDDDLDVNNFDVYCTHDICVLDGAKRYVQHRSPRKKRPLISEENNSVLKKLRLASAPPSHSSTSFSVSSDSKVMTMNKIGGEDCDPLARRIPSLSEHVKNFVIRVKGYAITALGFMGAKTSRLRERCIAMEK